MTFDEEVNVYTQTIQDMKAAFERKDWAYLREHDHYEDAFTEQSLLVCHPVIFLECHGKMIRALGHTVDSVISFLCSVGYKITAPKVRMVLR